MSWSDAKIQAVWEKAAVPFEQYKDQWRKDKCGAWIFRAAHGDRASKYGWEIYHVNPDVGDVLENLQPLHWENNLAVADTGRLVCKMTSKGKQNVRP